MSDTEPVPDLRNIWWPVGLVDGPGSTPKPYTTSPGVLAYTTRYFLTCDYHPPDTVNGRTPFHEWIVAPSCPSFVVACNQIAASYVNPALDFFSLMLDSDQGGGTLAEFEAMMRRRWDAGVKDYFPGAGPNLEALDAIDVSDLPHIFHTFKAEFYSIFQYQQPFKPARYMAGASRGDDGTAHGWDRPLLDTMYDIFESGHEGAHALEKWWMHACVSLSLEAVEAHR